MVLENVLRARMKSEPEKLAGSTSSARQAARDILLLCTAGSISPGRKRLVSQTATNDVDWNYLLKLAELHGITPLIARNLNENEDLEKVVPDSFRRSIKQVYSRTLFTNVILSRELTSILTVFRQHGIDAIVLKGVTLAEQLYGNLGLRAVSDMDILVRPEDISRAGHLLEEMGYQQLIDSQSWDHPFHEAPYCRQAQFPLVVELHRNLDDENLISFSQKNIWQRAQSLEMQDGEITVLSPEDNILFLSDHLTKHSTHLLMLLNDIAELLKKYREKLDWDYIVKTCRELGLEVVVYNSLKWAYKLIGAPVPQLILDDLKPGLCRRRLMNFLVGRKTLVNGMYLVKLRDETYALVRSLMMRRFHQMVRVFSRNHRGKRLTWFRTILWIILVFGAASGRTVADIVSRGD